MPLFEFECRSCQQQFEALVRPANPTPACPSCGGVELERLLSTFAVDSEGTRNIALTSGRKHAAKRQRDKAIADREHEISHEH
jgi:putative FmdB family regulatory protein